MKPEFLTKIDAVKAEIEKHGVLDPALLKNLDEWYRIELTYTSNALEGNTLTRQETALVVEKDISIDGKQLRELIEAKNHGEAVEFIKKFAKDHSGLGDVTLPAILDIHRIILQKNDDVNAGRLRNVPVRISGSTSIMPNPASVPKLMEEFITWLSSSKDHSASTAIEAHYRFVSIHPFTDGNGRTARLLLNLILLQNNYPPVIIHPEDRRVYVTSLEKAQTGGSKDDYENFMLEAVLKSAEEYLKSIK
ncbi:MAG: Fic family protein [Candidatus Paceibacterota bacterium]|jgi:Fic family protein